MTFNIIIIILVILLTTRMLQTKLDSRESDYYVVVFPEKAIRAGMREGTAADRKGQICTGCKHLRPLVGSRPK